MKAKAAILICIAICVVSTVLIVLLNNQTNLSFVETAKCVSSRGQTELSTEETMQICAMFDRKSLYRENLSCGFSESVTVVFNDNQTFCIACDSCPVIYWKEKDKYFNITEAQKKQLHSILKEYGLRFYF